jgi:NADH dehydrogenase/NADH:ubiquinone oxidoreductase subunit G
MAKNQEESKPTLAEAQEALLVLNNYFGTVEETVEEEFELPSPDEINEMSLEEAQEVAAKLEMNVEDLDEEEVKTLLVSLHNVLSDEDVEKEDLKSLVTALKLPVTKKSSEMIAAVKKFIDELTESEEETTEEETTEEETDADAGETTEEETTEEGTTEEETTEEEAEAGEEIDDDEKEARLAAYNKVAKKKLKSYDQLEALLEDDAEETAEWGVPYIRKEEGYCCGLPLEEAGEHEGRPVGKCLVTGKKFVLNEAGDGFDPLPVKIEKKTIVKKKAIIKKKK